jgi:protein-tyrosine phosphatase
MKKTTKEWAKHMTDQVSIMSSGVKVFSNQSLGTFNYDKNYVKCAHTHKPLPLVVNGKTFYVYGGSASGPIHHDCDIYVALDGSAYERKEFYPWNSEGKIFISFYVTDMSVPKDAAEYKKMVTWLCQQILAGRKVHIGCIGGHGRTGTLLAAIVKQLTGMADAISYVRMHYCHKAVESFSQVVFLSKLFGITRVKSSKEFDSSSKTKGSKTATYNNDFNTKYPTPTVTSIASTATSDYIPIEPLKTRGTIWHRNEDVDNHE